MYDENDPAVLTMKLTGSIILSLIWTLLVSAMLFALAGCGGASFDGANQSSRGGDVAGA